jgi:hypothetical protein
MAGLERGLLSLAFFEEEVRSGVPAGCHVVLGLLQILPPLVEQIEQARFGLLLVGFLDEGLKQSRDFVVIRRAVVIAGHQGLKPALFENLRELVAQSRRWENGIVY